MIKKAQTNNKSVSLLFHVFTLKSSLNAFELMMYEEMIIDIIMQSHRIQIGFCKCFIVEYK